MPMLRGSAGSRKSRFAWGCLLVIATIALVVTFNRSGGALVDQEAKAELRAENYVNTVLFGFLTPIYVDEPAVGARYRDLIIKVQGGIMTDEGVARVRIWGPEGQLLFSTDERDKVGQAFEAQLANIRKAMSGKTVSVVLLDQIAAKAGLATQQEKLLETFAPLRISGRIPIQGVVQIDQRYDAIEQAAAREASPWRSGFTVAVVVFSGIAVLLGAAILGLSVTLRRSSRAGRHAAGTRAEGAPAAGETGTDPEGSERRARLAEEELQRLNAEVRELKQRAEAAEAAASQAAVPEERAKGDAPDSPPFAQATTRVKGLEEKLRETQERLDSTGMHRDGLIEQVRQVQQERDEARLEADQIKAAAERVAASAAIAGGAAAQTEQRARQAEGKVAVAQEELKAAEARLSELEAAAIAQNTLQSAGALQAVERADRAETKLEETRARVLQAEARVAELEAAAAEAAESPSAAAVERTAALEERAHALGQRAAAADDQARAAEERALAAEQQLEALVTLATEADERVAAAEALATEAEGRATAAETRVAAEDAVASTADRRVRDLGEQLQAAEQRAANAEADATAAKQRFGQLEQRVGRIEEHAAEAARQLQQAEERLASVGSVPAVPRETPASSTDVAPLPQEQATALRARLASASAQRMAKQPGVHHDVAAAPPAPPVSAEEEAVHAAVLNEVRGPLSAILGLSLTMKGAVESDEAKTMVRQLSANARRLEHLLADLQDVEAIAKGTLVLKRRKTDLEAMVTRIVGETPELGDRIVQLQAETAKASVDSVRAEQIVEALLFNALERTRSDMPVWVRVEPWEDGALVAVDDEASEDPAKAASRLTVADRLAQLHGGRLWAEPRGAGGTSFRVWLPEKPGQGAGEPAGDADDDAEASDAP